MYGLPQCFSKGCDMKNELIVANNYVNRNFIDEVFGLNKNSQIRLLEKITNEDSNMKLNSLTQYVVQASAMVKDIDPKVSYAFVKAIEDARLIGADITMSIFQKMDGFQNPTNTCYLVLVTEGGANLDEILRGITADFFGAIKFEMK